MNSLIVLDMMQASVTLRLQEFPITVRFNKRGIPIERVPAELKVKCIDYLASLQLKPNALGAADRSRKRVVPAVGPLGKTLTWPFADVAAKLQRRPVEYRTLNTTMVIGLRNT